MQRSQLETASVWQDTTPTLHVNALARDTCEVCVRGGGIDLIERIVRDEKTDCVFERVDGVLFPRQAALVVVFYLMVAKPSS